MLFNSANFTYWIFLGLGILLFLLVIISGGGDESQDIDTDLDIDADVDVDGDVDTDTDSLFFLDFLSWFGFGQTPLIILLAIDLSAWGVIGWILNVSLGNILGTIPRGFLAALIFIASFFISVFLGKLLSHPIGKIFASFGEDASGDRLIGCIGHVSSKTIPHLRQSKIGQVDVFDRARNLVTVEASLPDWAKVIPHRGQEVLIIDQQKHCYIVIAKDTSDQDKWLIGKEE